MKLNKGRGQIGSGKTENMSLKIQVSRTATVSYYYILCHPQKVDATGVAVFIFSQMYTSQVLMTLYNNI